MLNSQPIGFYAPAQIVRDAQEHGVDVRPVDFNFSDLEIVMERSNESGLTLAPRHAEMVRDIWGNMGIRFGASIWSKGFGPTMPTSSLRGVDGGTTVSATFGCAWLSLN